MKTFKRFLTLLLISTLTLSVWGAEAEYVFNAADLTGTTLNGAANSSWSISAGTIAGYNASKGIQTTANTLTITSSDQYSNITKVVLDYSTNSSSTAKISVAAGSSTSAEQQVQKSQTNSTLTFNFTDVGDNKTVSITMKRNGTAGSLYVKKVIITYGSGSSYTITAESNNDSWGTVSGTTTITASPAVGYQIKESEPYTVTSGSATVTRGTGANSNKFTVSASSDCTVRINFEAIPTYAIRFFNNGTQIGATQNIAKGSSPVVPSDPAACDEGYAFVGWWTAELAEDNTTTHTWVTDFTVSGAQDYYAVFSHPDDEGGGTVTFNFATIATEEGWTAETDNHYNITKSTVNIFVTKGSASYRGRWWSDDTWRIYSGNKITISSTSGNITAVSSAPSQTFSLSDGKATLNANTTIKFTSISVTYGTTYYTTDCGAACSTPTLVFDVTEVTKFDGDAPFIKTATLSNNQLEGTITYSSNLPLKAEVNATTGEVTIHDAMSSTPIVITATVDKVTSGVKCQKKVTATYTLNIYNKVTWSVNGTEYHAGSPTEQTTEGGSITAYPTDPDGSSVCGGKTFVGWTDAPYAESDDAPTTLYTSLNSMSGVHPTENVTFYAVFAETTSGGANKFKRITSDDDLVRAAGTKIAIISNNANKILQNDFSVVNAPTPDGEGVITVTDNQIWTLTEEDEYHYWSLMSGSVQLGVEATSGYTSGYYVCGNYSTAASYWHINHASDFSGTPDCFYLYNWSNNSWYDGLEFYGGTTNKWESVYFASANTNFKNYCAMQIWGPYSSYTGYSTTCGPNIKVGEVERLTSTKDQTVKSQAITVKGSNLDGSTLTASITGTNASQFSCTLATNTITTGAIETTFIISYNPGSFDTEHTAILTFSDGTTTSDPITLLGRSLPEHFAIVGFDGANYYVLDGTMTSASTVKPIPVTITAGSVDLCPSQAVYTLTERSTPDQNVHLVGPTGRRLFGGSNTNLNTHTAGSTEGTGWLLATNNFNTYHITNATTTDRGIMYNDANNVFGHYKNTNYSTAHYFGDIRLMPITNVCTCLPMPNSTSIARATTATITWEAIEGAASYEVTCSAGVVNVDGLQATISGLSNNTAYTYTVKAVATGTDCSLTYNGAFTTTDCDDVPSAISVVPALKTTTFKWTMIAPTATIRIYSDEECTAQVGSDHTGQTSPATIVGLEENTQYYAKIYAGGSCESGVIPFLTRTTTVEIVEWFSDSIRINLGADENSASVIIEDKQEKTSGSTNIADKLFFSKYFEADGNNKMIAIYNGTADPIDITNMWLKHSNKGASESRICLKRFGKTPGIIAPNEEIIIMRFTTDADPAIKCAEKEDNYDEWNIIPSTTVEDQSDGEGNNIYNWLQFSGPQSIGLFDGNTNTFIDVIGATTNASGTGSLVQISASNKVTCTYTQKPSNDGSGFYAEGKEVDTDNDILLSTNRCLLIRKNTVKFGDDAISNNVYSSQEACDEHIGEAFHTLGSEWVGYVIGKGDDAAEKTCEGLAFVGGFDYQGYYVQYEEVTTVDELSGKRNEDGTYTIPIPQLDTLSCTMLRVKVYEGTEEKASAEYKVPIMVEGSKKTNNEIFKKHEIPTCKECDVVILRNATLEKTDEANDRDEVRNLMIYPGGKLVVPSGKGDYTVQSVQFRVEKENAPLAKLIGNLITKDEQVIVSRRIKNDRYYFFSLPYDCNIADIHWANGEPATIGVDYQIVEYDGARRANEGSGSGVTPHWTPITGTQLKAGVGYNIAVSSSLVKELIFPMAIGGTNLTNIENTKTAKTVAIHQYTNAGTTINNHNWNLVAHPYVSAFEPYSGDKITAGILEYTEPASPGEQGTWEIKNTSNVYLTLPSFNNNAITYTQTLAGDITSLDPFLAVFVQGAGEGDLTFEQTGRKLSAPARHLAAAAEDEDESIFVGVTLSGNGESDQTCVRIRPDFTDEYQLGYDLDKFVTFYTSRPQVYMKTPSYRLAFQAVSDEVAKSTFLPMGVYCYQAGTYTFGLNDRFPTDEVEAVYLFDKQTGVTTNLLYDTYSFSATKQVYTNTRFSLNVIVNRRAPQTATGMEATHAPDDVVRKILINGHVYIQRGGVIYDVTGKQMLNHK